MTSPSFIDPSLSEPADSSSQANKKRSSRACDQCRRTKSKCRKPTDPNRPCSNCVIAGLTCTFQGPSYKRGPPKGYISAIEQRLHQVEAILGAIVNSSDERSQSVISALKVDGIASEIIDRVNRGPYGAAARSTSHSPGPADFSATIRQLNESRDSRAARDSRVNRESLSSAHHEIPAPSPEWLKRLDNILGGRDQSISRFASSSGLSSVGGSDFSEEMMRSAQMDSIPESEGEKAEKEEDEEAIGKLSVNDNDEIRYHDESSGMPLLDKIADNSSGRNFGGIWRLPTARIWPYAPMKLAEMSTENDMVPIQWPSLEHEELLIQLFFTYVHPDLPILHKPSFMALYQAHRSRIRGGSPGQSSNKLSTKLEQLLLLSVFTVSSRFYDKEMPKPGAGSMWEAGCDYLASARRILTTVMHTSALHMCQALVILAYREFGLGSLEQSSSFMNMAIRLAQDLGLHRSSDRWQRHGVDLFSPGQKQERKHIWWSCAVAEKNICCALGKPILISEKQYDTELPEDRRTEPNSPLDEEVELWQSHSAVIPALPQPPVLSHTLSTFKAAASLSVIIGRIIEKIYAIRQKPWSKKQRLLYTFEKQLEDWQSELPTHLHYDMSKKRPVPPQTLILHIQHSAAMILLHRRFIPRINHKESAASAHGIDTEKEFALCQMAASRISALASTLREVFTLKAVSAYLPSYLMSAGIVHLAALSMNRGDIGQSISALRTNLACLKEMEFVWPSALRNYELLGSAYAKFEANIQSMVVNPKHIPPTYADIDSFTELPEEKRENTRLMAQFLGLEIPGISSSTAQSSSWSRASTAFTPTPHEFSSQNGFSPAPADFPPSSTLTYTDGMYSNQWLPEFSDSSNPFQGYDFQSFTNPDFYY